MNIPWRASLWQILSLKLILGLVAPCQMQAQIKPLIKKGTTRAVVIGVADYQNPNIPDLQFTAADAKAYADYLRSSSGGSVSNDNIKLLTDTMATQWQMAMALTWLMEQSQAGDLAIIYFSGHGDVETMTMMNFGYLLTHDAPASTYMAGGAFPINSLEAIIQTMAVQKNVEVLLIADACHAGKLAGSAVKGTQVTAQALTAQFANAAKILSCQPDELSQESTIWGGGHSVFTYYLIDGLIGMADRDKDNKVTLLEMQQFLLEKVPPAVAPKSQNPSISGKITLQLAKVDPAALAALIARRQPQTEPAKPEPVASTIDIAVKTGDSLTMAVYRQFKQALKDKQLLHPKESSAYALYQRIKERIKDKPALADDQNQMRNDLAAGLLDEAQQAINAYLAASPTELRRRWSYDTSFKHYPEYLAKAGELLGPQHFSYTDLKAKQLYFEGLNIRLAAEQDNHPEMYDNARQRQELAITLSPNAAYAYNELGLLSRRKKEYEKSIEYFNKAIELTPTWRLAQTNLCSSYIDINQVDNAVIHCNLAIQSDSSFSLAWHNLGITYYRKEDYGKAIDCYLKALSLNPNYPATYYTLGNAYYFAGDKNKAEAAWRAGIQVAPKDPYAVDFWRSIAELSTEKKDFETALTMLNNALAVQPGDINALYEKTLVLATLGKDADAFDTLKLALEKGYKRKKAILSAPELEKIRNMPTFSSLMEKYFPE